MFSDYKNKEVKTRDKQKKISKLKKYFWEDITVLLLENVPKLKEKFVFQLRDKLNSFRIYPLWKDKLDSFAVLSLITFPAISL